MREEINIGIVGAKFMGRAHSNGYILANHSCNLPLKPVLRAACDIDKNVLQSFSDQYGWLSVETSWEKLIQRDDIDLIDICTSNSLHSEIAIAAAKAGKHIICEKPLAINADEARRMLDAANQSCVKHLAAFNYRRVPAIVHAKNMITEGKIGKIYHFNAVYYQDWLLDPDIPFSWRLDASQCGPGGASGEMNAHIIDLARYLVGEIESVCTDSTIFIKERMAPNLRSMAEVTTDDAANTIARFQNGAMGTFLGTRFAAGKKNYMRIEIFGSQGSLIFNLERLNELEYYSTNDESSESGFRTILVTENKHPYMKSWWPPGHIIGWDHTFVHEICDMILAIGNNHSIEPSFYDGLKCQIILDAIVDSMQQKKWINIDNKI